MASRHGMFSFLGDPPLSVTNEEWISFLIFTIYITFWRHFYLFISHSGDNFTYLYHVLEILLPIYITFWRYFYLFISHSEDTFTYLYHILETLLPIYITFWRY